MKKNAMRKRSKPQTQNSSRPKSDSNANKLNDLYSKNYPFPISNIPIIYLKDSNSPKIITSIILLHAKLKRRVRSLSRRIKRKITTSKHQNNTLSTRTLEVQVLQLTKSTNSHATALGRVRSPRMVALESQIYQVLR